MQQFACVQSEGLDTAYMPLHGFTAVDLGYQQGNAVSNLVNKMDDKAFTSTYLTLFEQIWNDTDKLQDVTTQICDHIASVYQENSPERIYFLMLYNIFNEFLEDLDEDVLPNDRTTTFMSSFHSDWLSMMYPRLKLARNLLREDGVIFISIDENEIHNLRKIADEIFGEGNFISQAGWQKVYSPKNQARYLSNDYEFVLIYAKDILNFQIGLLPRTEEMDTAWSEPCNFS